MHRRRPSFAQCPTTSWARYRRYVRRRSGGGMPKPPTALSVMSSAVRDDQPRLCAPPVTSATGAAAALASAPGRRPAGAGAPITWLPGDEAATCAGEHSRPGYAWRGSPSVDAVVTALALTASRRSVSARSSGGPIRRRRAACALVATSRAPAPSRFGPALLSRGARIRGCEAAARRRKRRLHESALNAASRKRGGPDENSGYLS